jgi:hypothetical protein
VVAPVGALNVARQLGPGLIAISAAGVYQVAQQLGALMP